MIEPPQHSEEARYAGRIGRHAVIYGIASLMGLISGLASVVIYTRFLDPTEYGKVAVLLTISTVVTIVAGLGSLQGTMRRVYGTTGDDEGGFDDVEGGGASSDPRMALATGLLLTCVVGTIPLVACLAASGRLADLILGSAAEADLLIYAVGAGATAAVMRLARNMLRLQLRSGAYLAITTVFALGSTVVAVPLLIAGMGIDGVMVATISANLAAALLSVHLLREDVRLAFSRREAKEIMKSGGSYLPIVLSFQVLQVADTLFVAGFASFSEAGLYRVSQRVAQPVSYGTSVFQQAWGPMRHDLTQAAVDRKDSDLRITARLITYYAVFVLAVILPISIFADQLVRLAASEYGTAAGIVPLTTLSVAGHGWFILSYRTSQLPRRRFWLTVFSVLAAVLFAGAAPALIAPLGAHGAPIAAIAVWVTVTAGMIAVSQLRGTPVPYESGKLATAGGSALVAWLVGYLLIPGGAVGIALKLLVLALWAVFLFATRIVPLSEVRSFIEFARHSRRHESRPRLRAGVKQLQGVDAQLVEEVVRRGLPVAEVAASVGLDEDEVLPRTVQALRSASGGDGARPTDAELGALILLPRPLAEQDRRLLEMVGEGMDPIDADLVVRTASAVRGSHLHLPRRRDD